MKIFINIFNDYIALTFKFDVFFYNLFSLPFFPFFKILVIYFYREGKGRTERGKHRCARETLIGCLSHSPSQGPGPQPRQVP